MYVCIHTSSYLAMDMLARIFACLCTQMQERSSCSPMPGPKPWSRNRFMRSKPPFDDAFLQLDYSKIPRRSGLIFRC